MKRPAFQFYPADWRKDVELRSCSIGARGLWIDMICIAHECDPYGHLTINGKPMTAAKLAGQVGLTAAQCKALLDELIENGVARVNAEGVIYCKRMVEDEDIRNRRAEGGKAGSEHGAKGAEHGKKGGRPRKETGESKTPLKTPLTYDEEPPPSTSPSSSTSPSGNPIPDGMGGGESESPSPGLLCRRLRAECGIADVNPSHPKLLALMEAGATPDEFVAAAQAAVGKSRPFAYVLTVVENQRRDAAAMAERIQHGPVPTAAPVRAPTVHDRRAQTIAGLCNPGTPTENHDENVIDAYSRVVG